jgi:hypothetical protein
LFYRKQFQSKFNSREEKENWGEGLDGAKWREPLFPAPQRGARGAAARRVQIAVATSTQPAMKLPSRPPLLPPRATAPKLFLVGSTVGPVVDSLHNQCLLAYDIAPITLMSPSAHPLFCSSWVVPPLLGAAYIVLGYILPRIIELMANSLSSTRNDVQLNNRRIQKKELKSRAILAVTSTALIIKLSQFLQTHDAISLGGHTIIMDAKLRLFIMVASDALQWISLDRTPLALVAATITALGGPLSELPFVASGFWHYIPQAADYLPLSGDFFQQGGIVDTVASNILGEGYHDLALSSITGPCYFAVTMDAIALTRYFDQSGDNSVK